MRGKRQVQEVRLGSVHMVICVMPNVRVKPAPTVGRQARDAENVRRTCIPGLVARRWGSA